jgi:hypothetical protein
VNLFTDFDFTRVLEVEDDIARKYDINSTKELDISINKINNENDLLEISNSHDIQMIYGDSKYLYNISTNIPIFNKKLCRSDIIIEVNKIKNKKDSIELQNLIKSINNSNNEISNMKDVDCLAKNNGIYVDKSKLYKDKFGVFANNEFNINDVLEIVPYLLIPEKDVNNELNDYVHRYDSDKFTLPLGYANLYNHKCEPNVTYSYSKDKEYIIYKAKKYIEIGEELFISYDNEWFSKKSIDLGSNLLSIINSNNKNLKSNLDILDKKSNLIKSVSSIVNNLSSNLFKYKVSFENKLICENYKTLVINVNTELKKILNYKDYSLEDINLEENKQSKFVNYGVTSGRSNLKNGGSGVFATKDFSKDETIEIVPFIKIDLKDADNILDCYIFKNCSEYSSFALGYGNLYNHQDESNVAYKYDTEKNFLIYKVVKSVKKGDELFINYGVDYWVNKGILPESVDKKN